jgi:integrase
MGKSLKGKELGKGHKAKEEYQNLVFITSKNTPVNEVSVYHAIKMTVNYINKVDPDKNFEMFSPHTLRHTFATRRVEEGMDPKILQKLMGHKHLSVTMDTYYHKADDVLIREVMEFEKNKQFSEIGVNVV